MKIAILAVRDTGAVGYCLAHAINKVTPEHHAINLRAQRSYINYPSIVDMGDYTIAECRKMVYNADVIVFVSAIKPIIDGLHLTKRKLKGTKKIIYESGSIWRFNRKQFIEQADKHLGTYEIALSEPGLFMPYREDDPDVDASFLPPIRSFSEIQEQFGMCNQDHAAIEQFAVPKKRVVFAHAPTSEEKKGSTTFFRAITQAMQLLPNVTFLTIRQQPWVTCLRMIASADVLLDQDPPFQPVSYGGITIEASIFKLPVITKIDPRCIAWYQHELGMSTPFITWNSEEELLERVYRLATNEKLRHVFGDACYTFCKALHDEQAGVERFFKIVEAMD